MTVSQSVGMAFRSSLLEFVSRESVAFSKYSSPRSLSGTSTQFVPLFHDPLKLEISLCQVSAKLFGKFRKFER